ncbi:MAG TPA: class I SAM-dependent rRNA methyltransferase [Rhizomicrobium sp.]|nr:class I SAM-dependent rRNA methyltransferase [Rhizomicrobium sp.]
MSKTLPLIRLKPREGRRVRGGSPWAFSNEIEMSNAAKALEPGALVNLAMEDGRVLGTGYFNVKSLIAVRLLSHEANAEIGKGFLAGRLARALALREALYARPFYRLVHAEGDGLPGLTIDRFGDTLVLQITTAGMETLLEPLLAAIDAVLAPQNVILRNDTPVRALEGLENDVRVAKGEIPSRITVEENGARYFADLGGGQKTGWYYDQRDNRAFIASLAKDKSVLDAYCYTGGFGVLAAKAGAREMAAIDSSQNALTLASEASSANGVEARTKFIKADAFEELERLAKANEKFDIVICDPPPFAKSRKDVEAASRAYRKLARAGASVTAKNGFLLLASCSYNMPLDRFTSECAIGIARTGRSASLIRQAGASPDHPAHPHLPETAYLKSLVYALD